MYIGLWILLFDFNEINARVSLTIQKRFYGENVY